MERIKKALQEAREQRQGIPIATNRFGDKITSALDSGFHEYSQVHENKQSTITAKNIATDDEILEKNKILYADTPMPIQRAYKMLRTRFLQQLGQNNWNTIAVISPTPNDGKTLTAINLGISIAQNPNHTALLVDLDLLQPSLYTYFDFEPEASINESLYNGMPVEECFVTIDQNFFMAPAKQIEAGSSEILASQAAKKLAKEIKFKYQGRVILYDLPPILVCDDALSFLPNVDAVLLVLREGKTKRTDVKAMMNMLHDKPIVGVVLNDSKYDVSDQYYY